MKQAVRYRLKSAVSQIRKRFTIALLSLPLLFMTAGETAAQTTVDTLVSNADGTTQGNVNVSWGVKFTTGSLAATLTDVSVFVVTGNANTVVRIRDGSTTDPTGDVIATLNNPSTFTDGALNTFTAPSGITLAANTTYFLVVNDGVTDAGNRAVFAQTSGKSQTGVTVWTIADDSRIFTARNSWIAVPNIPQFVVRGQIIPPDAPTGLSATAGNAQVALSWADPDNSNIGKYQYRQGSGSPFSWGSWTDIPNSDATTTGHTVTGLNNSTEYSFQVRAFVESIAGNESDRVSATTPNAVSFVSATATVAEDAGNVDLMLELLAARSAATTIQLTSVATSASEGEDFMMGPYSVTFPAATTQAALQIAITDDNLKENNETFQVSIVPDNALPAGLVRGATPAVTVTIEDDEPTAFFVASNGTHDLPEGAVRTFILVLRNVNTTKPATTFTLTVGGNADASNDYTLACSTVAGVTCNLSGSTPSITVDPSQLGSVRRGQAQVNNLLSVTAIADGNTESRETVTLSLGDRTASFGIVDPPSTTTIQFNRTNYTVPEVTGPAEPIITISPPFGSAIDVNFTVTGTAASAVDYNAISMPVTIPAGLNVFDFEISMIDDALIEGDETIILTMNNLPTNVSAGDPSTATITIKDNDNVPVITSPATESVAENTTAVLTVMATDADEFANLEYLISGGADRALFNIARRSGALTFMTAPDFEMPTDQGRDNEYIVEVTATDGQNNSEPQTITITVTEVNEAPVLAPTATASVAENTTTVLTVMATDADAGTTLRYSISGGADRALFSINNSGALTFMTAPDFEMPTDQGGDNEYEIIVTVSDNTNNAMQTITVTVTDENDNDPMLAPTATASVAENTTAVLTVMATDADAGTTLRYSISGGADRALFGINNSGALTFMTAPDFEMPTDQGGDNEYEVIVTVSDDTNNAMQTITVTVTNENEAPMLAPTATASVAENTTAVLTITATDADAGTTLRYSISGGADQALFSINNSGALNFMTAPDFEMPTDQGGDNEYEVIVTVSDDTNNAMQTITVTVTDENEAPMLAPTATASVAENTTTVLTITATDADAGTTLRYSISGGADQALFSINNSGALTFMMAPDFEMPTDQGGDNEYEVIVTVSDDTNNAMQTITVTVTNENEAPMLAPTATASVAENTTTVLTVMATDADAGTTLRYSISGGADQALFSINNSGALTFSTTPDFEMPTDQGGDNEYELIVTVSDDTNNAMQTITITVTDENDNTPMITSPATASVAENTTTVLTVTATDADAGTTLRYSISGGADQALFSINNSGALNFMTAPDFEMPTDQGGDNEYELIVTVSDDTNNAMQTITVTVTNDPSDDSDDDPLGFSADEEAAVIFPNPSGDYLEVRSPVGGAFKILSLSGKSLLEGSTNTRMDITSLQSGLYLVQLPDGRLLKFVRE